MRQVRLGERVRVNTTLTNEVSRSVIDAPKANPSLTKVRKRHGLIDTDMFYFAKTERGLLASITPDKADAVWLPLSQIEYARKSGTIIVVTMPEWLYIEKGFDKRRNR